MLKRCFVILLCGLFVGLAGVGSARAQHGRWWAGGLGLPGGDAGENTIVGQGDASVRVAPTSMRVYVELLARGATVKEALAKLKTRRDAAVTRLTALGVGKDSFAFGSPSVNNAMSAKRQEFERMVHQRFTAQGKPVPAGLKTAKSVTVSCLLRAEWPLKPGSVEERLTAVTEIQDKVKAADLAGAKEVAAVSPEEQEILEESQENSFMMSNEEPPPLGEPVFVFLARLSDAQRDQALAEACKQAEAEAQRLARAAKEPLGPLAGLSGGGDASGFGEVRTGSSASTNMFASSNDHVTSLIARDPTNAAEDVSKIALSAELDPIEFTFMVRACYRIAK